MNLWIRLSDCGVDAASLDIVAERFPNVPETGTQGAEFDWPLVRPVSLQCSLQKTQPSVSSAGNAMMFDQLCVRRTSIRSGMTKERYAIETWMFAPSAYAMDQFQLFI